MSAQLKTEPQVTAETPVSAELAREIEYFLLREARLLDTERYDEWLALMAEDIHYWMPAPENRRRQDKVGSITPTHMAYFDDDHLCLSRRVARFQQPSAWAEDPATRHVHVVAGIECYHTENDDEFLVHSTFVNYRSRVEVDNDQLVGRREDLIRRTPEGLRLARRKILITQNILQAKNLNTFL